MARDLPEIHKQWALVREHGTKINQLVKDAEVAFLDAGGAPQPPDPTTIANIIAQADIVIPQFEAAVAAMKVAYTL